MVTLAKVAKQAGVSIATVSKVLSNTPYFTEETRVKVMKAVDDLGYVPNLAGRALSSGKTLIVGVIFPHIFDGFSQDPFTLYVLEGIEAECSVRGYNLLLSTPRLTASGPDENYLRLIRSGYLDGVVAFDNVPTASVLNALRERKIPAINIGYGIYPYYVRSDDRTGSQAAMTHLLELGHRNIGMLVVPPLLHYCVSERIQGYAIAASNFHTRIERFPRYEGDFSIRSGAECMGRLLDEHPEVTAVVCINDRMAFGAIQEAHRRGLNVPHDISVVGYDDIPMAELFAPSLTTVKQDAPILGRIATEMLFELMNNEIPDSVILPPELVVRQSTAPPKI